MQQRKTLRDGDAMEKFALGGLSCMSAAAITNPTDVIKVRLQLQGKLMHELKMTEPKYSGFFRGGWTILQEEGVRGLWKGVTASLWREGTYSTLRMGLYEPLRNFLHGESKDPIPLWKRILAGGGAGMVGAGIANPTDLIKVQLQADSTGTRYKGFMDAFFTLYKQNGITGLYLPGFAPNVYRAMVLTASQLPSYDHTKRVILDHGWMSEGVILHFTCSMFAGLVCATTTSPLDLAKSRMMNSPHEFKSLLQCLRVTIRNEGFFALWNGWLANVLRIGPHTIVTFTVLEQLRRLTGIKPM